MKKYLEKIKNLKKSFDKKRNCNFDFNGLTTKTPCIYNYTSIIEAMEIFKQSEMLELPVANFNNEIIGILSLQELIKLISRLGTSQWKGLNNYHISMLNINSTNLITYSSSLNNILEIFSKNNQYLIPIVDEKNTYTGYCISPLLLIKYTLDTARPTSISGLATPIGIYLTDGHYSAGAGSLGLILTGILFSFILNLISLYTLFFILPYNPSQSILLIFQIFIFVLILRIMPLANYHAAEHQTINAIEKGVELTIENVKNQPREHIRCGTNLMILMLGIMLVLFASTEYLNGLGIIEKAFITIAAFIIILKYWRKIGMYAQKHLTTAVASDKYLLNAINTGKQLLNNYKNNTVPIKVSFLKKLWKMGIFQILISFLVVSFAVEYFLSVFLKDYLI